MMNIIMKLIKTIYGMLDAQYEAVELIEMLTERSNDNYYDVLKFDVYVYSLNEANIEYIKGDGRSYNDRGMEKVYYKGLKRLLPFTFLIDLKTIQLKHKLLKENAKTRKLHALKMHYSNKHNTNSNIISDKAIKKLKNKGIFVTFKEQKDII